VTSYLDHASLSPLRPEVAAFLSEVLELPQADPGRAYDDALAIRRLLEDARDAVASLAAVTSRQVVFTSSIPESVLTALRWLHNGGPIALAMTARTSVIEHAASFGELLVLPVDAHGHLDLDMLTTELTANKVSVVCAQVANHETGTIDDAQCIVDIAHEKGARVVLDATMAFGHVPFDAQRTGADATIVTGELLGAPVGCSAVIVKRGLALEPLFLGGAQERGRRTGLENILGIAGFGAAASVAGEPGRMNAEATQAGAQISRIEAAALAIPGVTGIGDPDPHRRVPYVRCFEVAGVEAEPVLMGLNRVGIEVHSGSACASETFEPSPVMAAMGLTADRSMRVSVGWSTSEEDIARFERSFGPVVDELRALGGL
jgi:cysteine desulfurase